MCRCVIISAVGTNNGDEVSGRASIFPFIFLCCVASSPPFQRKLLLDKMDVSVLKNKRVEEESLHPWWDRMSVWPKYWFAIDFGSLSLCVFRVDYGSRLRVHFPYFSPTHTFLPPSLPPVLRHFLFHHTFSVSQSIWHTQHTLKVGGGGYIAWGVEKNIPSFFIRIFLVRIDPAQCANIPLS